MPGSRLSPIPGPRAVQRTVARGRQWLWVLPARALVPAQLLPAGDPTSQFLMVMDGDPDTSSGWSWGLERQT